LIPEKDKSLDELHAEREERIAASLKRLKEEETVDC